MTPPNWETVKTMPLDNAVCWYQYDLPELAERLVKELAQRRGEGP